jgi:threonine dehydrogenase-like Zn-dependent dehydrogenase
MRTLLRLVQNGRIDLRPLLTHRFALDEISAAYDLFARQGDGVLKVALRP